MLFFAGGSSNVFKIVKMIMEKHYEPVIVFSFSKRECEAHAMAMSKLDFNSGAQQLFTSLLVVDSTCAATCRG